MPSFLHHRWITIPTLLTLSRFALVPIFVGLFLHGEYKKAFFVFVAAGITDFLDGYIARKFNMRSTLGSMLDPLADKFLMLLSFIMLSQLNYIEWWITYLVIGRDLGIVLCALILLLMRVRLYFKPTLISKINTTAQIVLLALAFLKVFFIQQAAYTHSIFAKMVEQALPLVTLITALLTLITAGQYAYIGYKFLRYGERVKNPIPPTGPLS